MIRTLSRALRSLSRNFFGPKGAAALAPAIAANGSLTQLGVQKNSMKDEGVKLLRDAVSGREGFVLLDNGND